MKLLKSLALASVVFITSNALYAAPITTAQVESTPLTQRVSTAINVNNADIDTLIGLPGIGKSKALAIIEYRENFGKFTKVSDIKDVKGIGEKLFSKLESRITVN